MYIHIYLCMVTQFLNRVALGLLFSSPLRSYRTQWLPSVIHGKHRRVVGLYMYICIYITLYVYIYIYIYVCMCNRTVSQNSHSFLSRWRVVGLCIYICVTLYMYIYTFFNIYT